MKKKLVVLDGFTLSPLQSEAGGNSPADPSWEALAALADLVVYDRTPADLVIERCKDAQLVLTNKVALSRETINALSSLEYIGVMATGFNIVDVAAARERGIPVTNVPGYSTASVAQLVFGLVFELMGYVGRHAAAVRDGQWNRCPDFCFIIGHYQELAGKTLGVVGFGAIGQQVAKIGAAFGMRVLVNSRTRKESSDPVEWVEVDELFKRADVISLHCPLTPSTENLVNAQRLGLMKPTAFLINTGRGPLIDEAALASALEAGVLAGFGGDVLRVEPPSAGNPLIGARNALITPHIAWASVESRGRLMGELASNLRAFLDGQPRNVVN